jgi:phosphonate transport system ATP-binding protein
MTLLASLHAVELALAHFPRIIGVREGRIVFDLPPEAIGTSALDALYANEQLPAVPTWAAPAPVSVQIPRC